ncbi:MAG: hypothetical protein J7L90_03720 [Dehalococcoidia bacterium]|nr:hypothetical protein [Dehalococcoidia bacterium]
MQLEQTLGLAAGMLVTCSMIPQLIRVFQLKSAREISKFFAILLLMGMLCWIAYGIYLNLTPIIIWNAIGAVLTSILLYAKLKYGK